MVDQSTDVRVFTTPRGGVMTREVGAITGTVEIWLDKAEVRIRYEGAIDAYTVGAARDRTIDEILALLESDPGVDGALNPVASALD